MRFTEKTAIKLLKSARCPRLEQAIRDINEEAEREYRETNFIRSDLSILKDEAEYLIILYEDGSSYPWAELKEARKILRETHNGKYNFITEDFNLKYTDLDIERSRATVNEYKRLKRLLKEI